MFILKYSKIFTIPRNFLIRNKHMKDLFSCALCLGFWCGVILMPFALQIHQIGVLLPFASAAVCWIIDVLVQILQGIDLIIEWILDNRS